MQAGRPQARCHRGVEPGGRENECVKPDIFIAEYLYMQNSKTFGASLRARCLVELEIGGVV